MEMKLTGSIREEREKVGEDLVPAVLYGRNVANINLKINRVELDKMVKEAGESNLISLTYGDSAPVKVLIKEIQRHSVNGRLQHVDFFQVNMAEKITTEIPLEFVGESKAVRELSGLLVRNIDALEVECLPNDLVSHIEVDISVLATFDDEIRVSDIKLAKGLELLTDAESIVALVMPPRTEAETEEVFASEGQQEEKKDAPKAA